MEKEKNVYIRQSKTLKSFNYLLNEIQAVYHDMCVKLGLSDSAMIILYTICDYGGECMLQEIVRVTGISKQTINSSIRRLEEEGYIKLNLIGGKNKNVVFTDKGYEFAKNTVIKIMDIENEVYSSWTKEDIDKYLELTEKYLRQIKEKSETL